MTDLLAGLCYIRDALSDAKVLEQLDKIAAHDGTTFMHCVSVAQFSIVFGIHAELSDDDLCVLTKAALLHDVGKMFVSHDILTKPDRLSIDEYKHMQTHVVLGADYLQECGFDERIVRVVREHHENYDGSGYPDAISSASTDILSQIIRIADTYDAMHSERPYQMPISKQNIYEIFFSDNGHCYNPDLIQQLM